MNNAMFCPKPVGRQVNGASTGTSFVPLNIVTRAIVRKNARYLVTLLNDRKSAP